MRTPSSPAAGAGASRRAPNRAAFPPSARAARSTVRARARRAPRRAARGGATVAATLEACVRRDRDSSSEAARARSPRGSEPPTRALGACRAPVRKSSRRTFRPSPRATSRARAPRGRSSLPPKSGSRDASALVHSRVYRAACRRPAAVRTRARRAKGPAPRGSARWL